VRLLHCDRLAAMSGEPAVTAARALATLSEPLPLYGYASAPNGHPDVVGECLRGLAELPASLLPRLARSVLADPRELVLVGLFDLAVSHPEGAGLAGMLGDWMDDTALLDAYRYLCSAVVADRGGPLLPVVLDHARRTRDPAKRAVLAESLALAPPEPAVRAVLAELEPDARQGGR
jgi:hypothetical protein